MASASLTQQRPTPEPNPFLGSVVGAVDAGAHRACLRLCGALCAFTAAEHRRQLAELVDQGYVDLRIDLHELGLCTSDGLDLWDDVQHRLDGVHGRLTLVGATGVVRRVFDVVTRSDVHFCPTIEAVA